MKDSRPWRADDEVRTSPDMAGGLVFAPWTLDELAMRYVDDELPWFLRIPVRAGVLLSPRFRGRVHEWRRFSDAVAELIAGVK